MTTRNPRSIAAVACGLAASLLFTGCSSGSSPVHATASSVHPASSSPSPALSTTADVVADGSVTSAAGTSVAGTSRAGAARAAGSACALITEHDATAVLGKDPGHGSAFSSHGSTQCQYGTYQTQFLLVNLTPTQGRAGYDLVYSHQKPGQNVTVDSIAGVGDRAFEVSGPNTAGIFANKHDALVVVTVTILAATSPPKGPVLTLAKLATSRL